MGVPLLFWVGATQPKVTLELDGVEGGAVVVELLPEVVVAVALSAMVGGVEEPVVLVAPMPDEPESSPPQPASANARLPAIAIQTKEPDPNPRLAFCMQPPKLTSNPGGSGHEVTINRLHERAAQRQLCRSHEANAITPATPLS